jgi:hypothetical protein
MYSNPLVSGGFVVFDQSVTILRNFETKRVVPGFFSVLSWKYRNNAYRCPGGFAMSFYPSHGDVDARAQAEFRYSVTIFGALACLLIALMPIAG